MEGRMRTLISLKLGLNHIVKANDFFLPLIFLLKDKVKLKECGHL